MSKGQKIQEDLFSDGRKLPLVEEFFTIQGEGYHTGKAAYFLRIGGCDVGCSWCDTKFTWDHSLHPVAEVDRIVENAVKSGASSVVVTGGEPLMYPLDYLCDRLKNNRFSTFLETSGAYPLSGLWNWICLSPKQTFPPLPDIYLKANELKVIIQTMADFSWAEKNAGRVNKSCKLYLQPEWSQYERIIPIIVGYVKSHQRWNISLQAHKFMHIP